MVEVSRVLQTPVVWLVRHAEVQPDGQAGVIFTERGELDRLLLKKKLPRVDCIITGPAERCIQTIEPWANTHDIEVHRTSAKLSEDLSWIDIANAHESVGLCVRCVRREEIESLASVGLPSPNGEILYATAIHYRRNDGSYVVAGFVERE